MKAAVLTTAGQPTYVDVEVPTVSSPDEALVDVLAAGIHNVTLGRASGKHYSAGDGRASIAGVDGVGRGPDGQLYYFVQGPGQPGTMADKTVIDRARSIVLPSDADPATIAGAMNPTMASWLALRCRVAFAPGQRILVLGATGGSGQLAVQVAKHLGAAQIIGVGRDEQRLTMLPDLGATDVVALNDARLGSVAGEVDVVLDFLWGDAAVRIMESVLTRRADRGRLLTWIHIGSMAGDVAAIPGPFLRSTNLHIIGSGHGSVPGRDMLRELPVLAEQLTNGTFRIDITELPLKDVASAWRNATHTRERLVLIP